MDVEVVTEASQLAELRPEWDRLMGETDLPLPFLSHAWHYAWWSRFGEPGALCIICLRRAGEVVGIAPLRHSVLRLRGIGLIKHLAFATGGVADYRDILMRRGLEWEVLTALLTHLSSSRLTRGKQLILRGIHGASRTHELLPVVARQQRWQVWAQTSAPCPYLEIPQTYDAYLQTVASSFRRELRRRWRNLTRDLGDPVWRFVEGDDISGKDLASFFRLHAERWGGKGGSRALVGEKLQAFHSELVAGGGDQLRAALAFLSVQGQDIGCIYGFVGRGVFYDYLPGFDPSLEKYSIGSQTLMKLIEFGVDQEWHEIDLMRGDEAYKFHYTQRCRHNLDYVLSPGSPWKHRLVCGLEALSS